MAATLQFNVTMPAQYVQRLQSRAELSGCSRSEEIRKAIDATEPRGPDAIDQARGDARKILQASMALRRLIGAGGAASGFLDAIESAADRLANPGSSR